MAKVVGITLNNFGKTEAHVRSRQMLTKSKVQQKVRFVNQFRVVGGGVGQQITKYLPDHFALSTRATHGQLDARCPHTHTHSNFLCVCVRLIKRFEWISLKIFANIFPISINSISKGSENYAWLIISIVYLTHSPYTTHPPRVYHKFVRANQYKLAISRFSMSIITKLYDPHLAHSLLFALFSMENRF